MKRVRELTSPGGLNLNPVTRHWGASENNVQDSVETVSSVSQLWVVLGFGAPTEPQSHLPKGTRKTSLPLMTLCHSPIPRLLSVSFPLSFSPDRNSDPKGNGDMKRMPFVEHLPHAGHCLQRLCKHI